MNPDPSARKRILFVDDEPLVLQGLQRMLRAMRNDWDMAFVDSGDKALETMDQTPFDVVVSDMRMPGMNGAQLLNALAIRYPDTIRIILSGHADQELIAQCLGSAHQYLSKPCDPELLKRLVNDACALSNKIASERIRQVVGSIERLPSLPATYQKLSELLAREDSTATDLGRVIAQDLAMTAKILKLVNSAFFGLRREISNPADAVTYLGTETVRSLVLASGIFEQADPLKTRGITLDDIWNHSLAVGQSARSILRLLKAPEQDLNNAFTGGLLHDIGILILASHFPEKFDEALALVTQQGLMLSLAEQRVFGVNHSEAGAYLIGLWGLPPIIIQCVQHHHCPVLSPAGIQQPSPVVAVHLADGLFARRSTHPAFERAVIDPSVTAQPWLVGQLEHITNAHSA